MEGLSSKGTVVLCLWGAKQKNNDFIKLVDKGIKRTTIRKNCGLTFYRSGSTARNGSSNGTLQQLVPSTRPKLSDIIAPSPAYYTPVLMPRTAYPETAYLSMKGNTTATATVRDDTSPCGNASNNTGIKCFLFTHTANLIPQLMIEVY